MHVEDCRWVYIGLSWIPSESHTEAKGKLVCLFEASGKALVFYALGTVCYCCSFPCIDSCMLISCLWHVTTLDWANCKWTALLGINKVASESDEALTQRHSVKISFSAMTAVSCSRRHRTEWNSCTQAAAIKNNVRDDYRWCKRSVIHVVLWSLVPYQCLF